MANTFTLTDGTTTVTLSSGSYLATNYDMAAPTDKVIDRVTETLDLLISGANLAAIQGNVRAVEQLLEAAKRRQTTQVGPKVYFTAQLDTEGSSWRAYVFDGRVEVTAAPDQLRRGKVDAALIFTRGPFEGALAQLTLSNGNGTDNTAGLAVYNNNDGTSSSPTKKNNYLAIDSNEVTGTLPAPVKLELTAASGSAQNWRQYWIAANSFNDPANFAHWIEGESRVTGYGTITANGASAAGNYNSLAVTTTGQMQWDLSAAQVQKCAGYPFRILMRYATTPPASYVQACVYDSTGLIYLAGGDIVEMSTTSNHLVDLGVLSIPPDEYSIAFGALRLVVKFWVTGTQTIGIDFLTLLPSATTRMLVQRGMQMTDGAKVILDETEQRAYAQDGGGDYPLFIMRANALTLEPGKAGRIYLLVTDSTADVDIADKWTAKAWYRPRRWSI